MSTEKFDILSENKIPEKAIPLIITGGKCFESMEGIPISDYWISNNFSVKDEFFVVFNAYIHLFYTEHDISYNNDWKLKFDVAFMFHFKANVQSVIAINELTRKHCYMDAFTICRTMVSRLNLLIICALNPNLFNEWLNNPKDEKFLDGHIRDELKNNGIPLPNHLYEFYSEIIHGHARGLSEVGYFEKGLLPEIFAIEIQIWVIIKFIIGMTYHIVLCMTVKDFDGKNIPERIQIHRALFNWILDNYLVSNRIDQVWTFLAEQRHYEKVGKDKYIVGCSYDYKGLEEQINKFHRKSQRKRLSKKYDI